VLPGFVPRLLWGVTLQAGGAALVVATDLDANGLPDAGSEQEVALAPDGAHYRGTRSPFSLEVEDSAGTSLGTLHLLDATFQVTLVVEGAAPAALTAVEVSGTTPTAAFLAMMMQVGGIDEAGASALLKSVFGVPATAALQAQLPVTFAFAPIKG
jgi:hypothetical protein